MNVEDEEMSKMLKDIRGIEFKGVESSRRPRVNQDTNNIVDHITSEADPETCGEFETRR